MQARARVIALSRVVRVAAALSQRRPRRWPSARWLGSSVEEGDRLSRVMADVARQIKERESGAAATVVAAAAAEVAATPGVQSPGDKMVLGFTCSYEDSPHSADAPERTHRRVISKKSYETGVVLVRCDCCEKLHLIADNLGWFDDDAVNVETIMADRGEEVRYMEDGTVESTR